MVEVIDGKVLAKAIRKGVKAKVAKFTAETGVVPTLAAVLVGEDPGSQTYVRSKERACKRCGMRSVTQRLPDTASEAELLRIVDELNADPSVHGILVQLPLPDHIDVERVVGAISPSKDVDGFHAETLGRLVRGKPTFLPCTPAGVMHILDTLPVELKGKEAVVVGRSLIVGKPLFFLLLERHMTVTVCHSRTRDLADVVRRADVVVAAVGKAHLVKGDWIKPGAIVIDVGINRLADGTLTGDVDFDAALPNASHITPVPGGVGRLTVAMLMENVYRAATLQTPA